VAEDAAAHPEVAAAAAEVPAATLVRPLPVPIGR
jgi:hypothetical protein